MSVWQRSPRAGLLAVFAGLCLSACGSSSPLSSELNPSLPPVTPTPGVEPTPPPGAMRLLEAGGYAVVASGTGVQLVGAETDQPWRQVRGTEVRRDVREAFVTPEVSVPTELIFSEGPRDTALLVQPRPSADCDEGVRCAGVSRRRVTPSEAHIEGVQEQRLLVLPRTQKFHLGGFGLNPTQNLPNPLNLLGEVLAEPASRRLHRSRHEHDEHIWMRALVLSEGGLDLVFLTLDAVGAGNVISGRMTERIAEATGVPAEHILFGQTHTHAGPDLQGLWGGVPQGWVDEVLYPAAIGVVQDALAARRTVRLELRQGEAAGFNSYRRPRIDPAATADPMMSLLQAVDLVSGQTLARLMQFNAHPTSVNEDPRIPHADYVLGAVDRLEQEGGVALFYNGPIADASARGGQAAEDADAYERVRARGEAMAQAALAVGDAWEIAPGLQLRQETAVLPVTNPLFIVAAAAGAFNRYYNFTGLPLNEIPFVGTLVDALPQVAPVAPTLVSRVTLGSGDRRLEIVTIPGEATNTFGQQIRELAGEVPMMLFGLTHNSYGYILPEDEFSYIDGSGSAGLFLPFTGYEEFVSLGPLTAPLLRLQAYAPLFDAGLPNPSALPPSLTACFPGVFSEGCILNALGEQLDYLQEGLKNQCLDAGGPAAFCGLLNPDTPLRSVCDMAGLPPGICSVLGGDRT